MKLAPIVDSENGRNDLVTNRRTIEDFPTPVSPVLGERGDDDWIDLIDDKGKIKGKQKERVRIGLQNVMFMNFYWSILIVVVFSHFIPITNHRRSVLFINKSINFLSHHDRDDARQSRRLKMPQQGNFPFLACSGIELEPASRNPLRNVTQSHRMN